MSKAYDIYHELLSAARCEYYCVNYGSNKETIIAKYIREGKEIPDRYLPGRWIMQLSEEKREELKKLTSNETSMDRI